MKKAEQPAQSRYWASWAEAFSTFDRTRTEVLGGLVTSFALIPEVISFSIVEGVDPKVGLYTSFAMSIVIAFLGGRPGMVTAAAGSVALVMAPLVAAHGVAYVVPTVLVAGGLQIVFGLIGIHKLLRLITPGVMDGFVNALAILIFTAQLRHLVHVPWLVYALVAVALMVMLVWRRVNSTIPAPLIPIVLLTPLTVLFSWSVPEVKDQGQLPHELLDFIVPDFGLGFTHFAVIAPYALAAAIVGLVESLLTAQLVDELTGEPSSKRQEACGLGCANVASAFVGGQGGCAMIGQTMINVDFARAKTRLSTLLAGVFMLLLVVFAGGFIGKIPMAVLVAIMFVVAFSTANWKSLSLTTLRERPWRESAVMVVTVIATVSTQNLAVGVVVGVVLSLFFRKIWEKHISS